MPVLGRGVGIPDSILLKAQAIMLPHIVEPCMLEDNSDIRELVTFIIQNHMARFGVLQEQEGRQNTQVTLNINVAAVIFSSAGKQSKVLEKSLFYRLGPKQKIY